MIDNKVSAVISKEDLVAYFQAPDAELGLINMNTVPIKQVDSLTLDVLEKNTDTVSSFKDYDKDVDAHGEKDMPELTQDLRMSARQEATKLIREWKSLARWHR